MYTSRSSPGLTVSCTANNSAFTKTCLWHGYIFPHSHEDDQLVRRVWVDKRTVSARYNIRVAFGG
jgi:hypothetical protein